MKTPDEAKLAQIQREAERGNPQAQVTLGYIYQKGKGLPQDNGKASEWYKKAANAGNVKAQVKLGGIYWKKDRGIAFAWHIIALENGCNNWIHRLTCSLLRSSLSKRELLVAKNFLKGWQDNH